MAKQIRVGFIGAGGIARYHARNLLGVKDLKLVALCDTSKKSLDMMRERIPETASLPTFSGYRKMLKSVPMDAVEIHTPHTLHYEEAMAALDHGLHVMLEKPMVSKTEHARRLIAKAKQKRLKLMVSYQRHYEPPYVYMRNRLHSGALGKINFVSAYLAQAWIQHVDGTWRTDPLLSGGGQLNDSGSHLVDMTMWATGLVPQEVFAYIDYGGKRVDVNSALTVKYKGRAMGTIAVLGNAFGWDESLTIWCDKGSIRIRGGKVEEEKKQGVWEAIERLPKGSTPDRHFARLIQGKEEPQAPPECGLHVIQLTEAAWKSAAIGKPVRIQ